MFFNSKKSDKKTVTPVEDTLPKSWSIIKKNLKRTFEEAAKNLNNKTLKAFKQEILSAEKYLEKKTKNYQNRQKLIDNYSNEAASFQEDLEQILNSIEESDFNHQASSSCSKSPS